MRAVTLQQDRHKIVWAPLAGSQTLSQSCPANTILFHGTRGPGKTDSQLMRFRRRVGLGYGRFWRGVIFDREYKNLDDLISKSLRWFPEFGDGARFISSKSDYKWTWPTGEELLFRAIKREAEYWGYHGAEFPFIGWNELTKYPTDVLFDMMLSCNRSSFRPQDYPVTIDGKRYEETGEIHLLNDWDSDGVEHLLPEIPLEVFATCNPYGAGHNWVKKRFINASAPGRIFKRTINVFNPRTQKREDVVKTQVHLFGSYKENKFLSPEYVAELETMSDPNKRRAWLFGDWDVVAGGMFDDVWDRTQNIVAEFRLPKDWKMFHTFDWGSSHPFSVGWWAESDGSDYQLPDGTWKSTVRGDQFRFAEWYGWSGKSNVGLRMIDVDISKGIIQRELAMGIYGRVLPGAADSSIWDVLNGNSYAANMLKPVKINGTMYNGVEFRRSDKSKGSRIAGWEKMRKYIRNAHKQYIKLPNGVMVPVPREQPGLFVFEGCKCFIDLVPNLPRDEIEQDDVDSEAEDHIGDETRYHFLSLGLGARGGRTKGML